MSLHSDLPIYRAAETLVDQTITIMSQVPKTTRATMGPLMLDRASKLGLLIRRANMAQGTIRADRIDDLLESLDVLIFQFRSLARARVIAITHHARAIETLDSIGAQAGGWKNGSVSSALSDTGATQAATSPVQSELRL